MSATIKAYRHNTYTNSSVGVLFITREFKYTGITVLDKSCKTVDGPMMRVKLYTPRELADCDNDMALVMGKLCLRDNPSFPHNPMIYWYGDKLFVPACVHRTDNTIKIVKGEQFWYEITLDNHASFMQAVKPPAELR